jgi:hypothetical protein
MNTDDLITGLPGETLVREGLADFKCGRRTIPACLVAMARPRLRKAGLIGDEPGFASEGPELLLYHLLRNEGGDAYSRYNALLRELVSFESALDLRLATGGHPQSPKI